MLRRSGVFLDRDGTLNVEVDFLRNPDQLRVIAGAAKAVRRLNDHELATCVISNQSGVARGFLTELDLVAIHSKLREELLNERAILDRIYYCPHHPTEGVEPYVVSCECRKPKPGMLLQGAREFNLDLQRSFVIGDSVVDMQAAQAVGATALLVQTGYGKKSLEQCTALKIPVARVVPSIVEAVDFILDHKGEHFQND